MEDSFHTVSTSSRNVKTIIITFIVMGVLACLGLMISFTTFIFLEAMLLIICIMMLLIVSKVKWDMAFSGTCLTITNMATNQQYYLHDLKRSDFVFSQSKAQKAKNCAHLKIVGSSAVFNDVQHFAELKAYIDQNFS